MKIFTFLRTFAFLCAMLLLTGSGWGQIFESFETGLPTSYTTETSYTLSSGVWTGQASGVIRGITGVNTGSYSCQLRTQTGAQITTPALTGGVGTISFYVSASTASGGLQIRVSADDGENWTQVDGSPISFGETKEFKSFVVDNPSVNMVQFYRTAATVYIDDVTITNSSPAIIVTPISLSDFTYIEGEGPSAEQSFIVSGSNLTENISIAAPSSYEISTGTGGLFVATDPITLTQSGGDVAETTIFVRLKADLNTGTYDDEAITASSAGADNKTVSCSGEVTAPPPPDYFVDFEGYDETKTSYTSGTVNLSGLDWNMTQSLIGTADSDVKYGARAARIRYDATTTTYGSISMLENKTKGIGTISFLYARSNFSGDRTGVAPSFVVEYSTDDGGTWIQAGDETNLEGVDALAEFSAVVNIEASARVRIRQVSGDSGKRWNMDDIFITDYVESIVAEAPTIGDGSSNTPYQIATMNNLYWISQNSDSWDKYFIQTADIYAYGTEDLDGGAGWTPIGNSSVKFTGLYDGQGHIIEGLFLKRDTETEYTGLFGRVDGLSTPGAIQNLGLVSVNINGYRYVGGIAGDNLYGLVKKCFVSGNVSGSSYQVGGLVGLNAGPIENSFSLASVYSGSTGANAATGGLVGENSSDISKSYSTGTVTSETTPEGGFIGNQLGGSLSNCFWDTEASGTTTGVGQGDASGVTGKTTAEMQLAGTFVSAGWEFQIGENIWAYNGTDNNGYPFLRFQNYDPLNVWLGLGSADWNSSGNWSENTAPNASLVVPKVAATSNTPLIGSTKSGVATSVNLTIEPNGLLTIASAGSLTVSETLTNNAGVDGLIIKSGGSLKHNTADVPATIERSLDAVTTWPTSADGWYFISSPVVDQAVDGVWTPSATRYDLYAWSEPSPGTWLNQKDGSNNIIEFIPGKGYLIAYEGAETKAFSGMLNNDNVVIPISFSGTKDGWAYQPGWNLIGNPFPSGLSWDDVEKTLLADGFAYAYISWDGVDNYVYIEDGNQKVIAPNQGFFVVAKQAGNLTLNNSMRSHGGTFSKNESTQDELILQLSNADHADQTTLRIVDNAEFTRDRRDALKMFSFADHVPQVYTHTSDEVKVAINSIPAIDEEKVITVGVRIPADGSYTLSASEISGRFQSSPLYLLNNKTGEVHNLKENPEYSFQATKGDEPALFELWFTQPTDVPQLPSEGLTRIYTHGQTLYLEFEQGASNRTLEVFDISGRKLVHKPLGESRQLSENLNLQTGVYIVRITSTDETETKRIFVE